jgi:hypothetical protein
MIVNPKKDEKYLYRPGPGAEFVVTVTKDTKHISALIPVKMRNGRTNMVPRDKLFRLPKEKSWAS